MHDSAPWLPWCRIIIKQENHTLEALFETVLRILLPQWKMTLSSVKLSSITCTSAQVTIIQGAERDKSLTKAEKSDITNSKRCGRPVQYLSRSFMHAVLPCRRRRSVLDCKKMEVSSDDSRISRQNMPRATALSHSKSQRSALPKSSRSVTNHPLVKNSKEVIRERAGIPANAFKLSKICNTQEFACPASYLFSSVDFVLRLTLETYLLPTDLHLNVPKV